MRKYITLSIAIIVIINCSTPQKRIKQLNKEAITAGVSLANESKDLAYKEGDEKKIIIEEEPLQITDLEGKTIIMNAVKDEESGEMVATEQLQSITVEAKFRNIAERNGYVDLGFNIIIPKSMQDPTWQIQFQPKLFILGDTMNCDKVYVTGEKYRKAQLKGYELYNKFLNSIIPDSVDFVHSFTYLNLLEIFIDRNFRQLGKLRNDSTIVDTTYAKSLMGVSVKDAIEHYTNNWLVSRNNRKKLNKDKMYKKYIKNPIENAGVRLDSIITTAEGDIKYHYVQSIKTRKNLRKVDMVLEGDINQEGKILYTMPTTEPLTFYISSMVAFTDNAERYMKKVIERNATTNTSAYIDFKVGQATIVDTLHNNSAEIARIKGNIRELLSSTVYNVDSLIITASSSPEGSYQANAKLAQNRAESIKSYFSKFIQHYQDSVKASVWEIDLTGGDSDFSDKEKNLTLKTKWIPEEWNRLENLLHTDTNIIDRSSALKVFEIEDLDNRERALQSCTDYKYIRSTLYPYLRTVKFDFHLHRKGMIKDTIHTTELDTVYMAGLKLLQERDYEGAITKLRTYHDYNTAVTFVCLDYNKSALQILETLPRSAKRDYMLAVVYSREGDERKAVEYYIHSCDQDPAMKFRGNLDPEIAALINKYGINKEEIEY